MPRGRPKGSKNKPRVSVDAKPDMQPYREYCQGIIDAAEKKGVLLSLFHFLHAFRLAVLDRKLDIVLALIIAIVPTILIAATLQSLVIIPSYPRTCPIVINFADYSTAANSGVGNITSSSVTCVDGSYLILGEGSDDLSTITSAPADMTEAAACVGASHALYGYYESRSAGAVTKSVTWNAGAIDLTAFAVVVRLQ